MSTADTVDHVLLTNGNVLRGTVSELGKTVYLTRDDESVIRLDRDQVRHIGKSLGELYRQRTEGRIDSDLRRLHADIRWCLRNGLVREAAQDVLTARNVAPSDPETYQLLRLVTARLKADHDPSQTPRTGSAASVQRVSYEQAAGRDGIRMPEASSRKEATEDNSIIEHPEGISEATFIQFSTRVQPILMNRCVRCHAKDDANHRDFQIHTALTSRWNPETVANENFHQVMRFVDTQSPHQSVLRVRASDNHGGRRFSLGKEGSVMMKQLDQWLERVSAEATELPFGRSAPVASDALATSVSHDEPLSATAPPNLVAPSWQNQASAGVIQAAPQAAARLTSPDASSGETSAGNRQMRRMPKVENPFDPEIFNRRYHRR